MVDQCTYSHGRLVWVFTHMVKQCWLAVITYWQFQYTATCVCHRLLLESLNFWEINGDNFPQKQIRTCAQSKEKTQTLQISVPQVGSKVALNVVLKSFIVSGKARDFRTFLQVGYKMQYNVVRSPNSTEIFCRQVLGDVFVGKLLKDFVYIALNVDNLLQLCLSNISIKSSLLMSKTWSSRFQNYMLWFIHEFKEIVHIVLFTSKGSLF